MGKIFDLPTPANGKMISYLVLSDLHSTKCNMVALKKILDAFQLIPIIQRRIILLGDILDIGMIYQKCPVYQHNLKRKDWDYFIEEIEKEKSWYDDFYSLIRNYVLMDDYIVFSEGNHEERLRRPAFVSHVPVALKHNFELGKVLSAEARGTFLIAYNDWFRIKVRQEVPLYLTHGQYCGMNPIKKHFLNSVGGGGSVIFGHTHEAGMMSFKNLESTIIGYNNPCLCGITPETQPKYLEGKSQNWSNGAIIVNTTEDHYFVNFFIVKDNRLALPTGEIL